MKRTIILILSLFFLFACTNEDRQTEEINKLSCVTSTERVTLKYKTVDEGNNIIDSKDDQDVEIITEGKDGYKDIVYCDDKVLNEWVYETATHEVVEVQSKEHEENNGDSQNTKVVDNGIIPPTNSDNDYTPPINSGTNENTTPIIDNETGGEITPPTDVCSVYPGNDGNGWWSSFEEASVWADAQVWEENSKWFLYGYSVYGGGLNDICGYYIVFY